jgi:hypothetical protein
MIKNKLNNSPLISLYKALEITIQCGIELYIVLKHRLIDESDGLQSLTR